MPAEFDFEENVNPVCGPEEGQMGAAQRLRIRVPNVFTQLSLGQSLKDDDAQGFAYAGFGVETEGHVFIDARGGTAASAVKIQGNGPIMLQTDSSNMSLCAAGNNMLHAGGVAMIAGDTDVVIAGGIKHGNSTNYPSDGSSPLPPDWVNGVAATVSDIQSWWSGVDTFAAAVEAGIIAVDVALAKRDKVVEKEAMIRAAVSAFLGSWGGGFNPAAGFVEDWAGSSAGATIVYGKGGLVLGSARSAGLFSAIGTSVGSLTCAGMLAPWTGITGLECLELRSCIGNAGLVAGKDIGIEARKNVVVAAVKDTVGIYGKNVRIGAHDKSKIAGAGADEPGTQAKTLFMKLASDSELHLFSGKELLMKAGDDDKTSIRMHKTNATMKMVADSIDIEADLSADFSTKKYAINVGPSDAFFGKKERHSSNSSQDGPGVFVDSSELRAGVKEWGIKVTDGSTAIGDKSNYVSVKGGNVTIKGSKMKVF